MLQITENARIELHAMLGEVLRQHQPDDGGQDALGFRVVVSAGGSTNDEEDATLGLRLDAVREGDQVIDHNGAHILLLDDVARDLVDGLVLDVDQAREGPQLRIRQA